MRICMRAHINTSITLTASYKKEIRERCRPWIKRATGNGWGDGAGSSLSATADLNPGSTLESLIALNEQSASSIPITSSTMFGSPSAILRPVVMRMDRPIRLRGSCILRPKHLDGTDARDDLILESDVSAGGNLVNDPPISDINRVNSATLLPHSSEARDRSALDDACKLRRGF
jgi:hypothetical protein